MKVFSLCLLLTTALFGTSSAQEILHCGADEMRINTLRANPEVAKAVIKRDAVLEAFTRDFAQQSRGGGSVYLIPVVFHVIHKYGNENISREQILDGIDVLNKTFRKLREDTADIHSDFKPIHADCEIEFRLATKDPEGNCHNGVNRIASSLTTVGDHQLKELVHWDPSMYLNIYIASNAAGLAGHAVWPADADTIPEWDGIVIAHNYVGSIGTSNPTQSVVLAHECGHYLNLHHIWGGNNVPGFYYLPVGQAANCSEDDLVGDTPNTKGWSSCNLSAASCGNTFDNVQNAMDYSYCNIMFTEGQKTRMHAALNSPVANRNNLWTNTNLIATGVLPEPAPFCAATFTSDKTLVCSHIDNEIVFENTSYNGTMDSLRWTFVNGNPVTSTDNSLSVSYSTAGTHEVRLRVYKDGSYLDAIKENYISVLPDTSWSYPFSDSFEATSSLNGMRWFENSSDTNNHWLVTDIAAHTGTKSVMVDNWDSPFLTIDELNGPSIDLSSATEMKIAFKYAFASTESIINTTKLQVQVSHNCAGNWSTRLNLAGSSLETVPPQSDPFLPSSATQWQQAIANIPSSFLEDGFRFRFLFTSAGSGRLFLDDINIDITASIDEQEVGVSQIELFPNPSRGQLTVSFNMTTATNVQFSVIDVLGKTVSTWDEQSYSLGSQSRVLLLENVKTGFYFLRIKTVNRIQYKRFIVQ